MLILEQERLVKMMNKNKFDRIFVIVLDSLGVGASQDACKYNDLGTNTLKHLSYSKTNFSLPTLQKLGIGNSQFFASFFLDANGNFARCDGRQGLLALDLATF